MFHDLIDDMLRAVFHQVSYILPHIQANRMRHVFFVRHARESVERILDKIEDIIPELREQEMEFDFDMEFGQQEEMEIGG